MRRFCHIEEKMFYSYRVNVEISFGDCSLRSFLNFQSFEGDVHIRVAGNVEETEFFDPWRLLLSVYPIKNNMNVFIYKWNNYMFCGKSIIYILFPRVCFLNSVFKFYSELAK